jgi:L-asparagine transporter-like permease
MPHEFSRSLKPRHVTMISIGGIIGAGLFVGSSAAIAATGPAIVISYLITGLLLLLVMRMLGEMAVALPHVRSFTEFARAALGPGGGFVAGWLYWYIWTVTIPVEAIAGATILHTWLDLPAWILGLALIAVMAGLNLMSARSYGEFEFWFASIKVAAIIVFIALAASYAFGFSSHHGPTFANLTSHGGFAPRGLVSVLTGAVTVYFSMTGAEITTIAAAESEQPVRAVAQMGTSVLLRILTFYVGSVLLIVAVLPWDLVRAGESPFTQALGWMHFSWAGNMMSVIILTAVLSCLNSAFYVCSRVLFGLAEHHDAPQWLIQLNGRRVPSRSVWIGSLAGVLGLLASQVAPQTVFAFLVDATSAVQIFVYVIIAIAHVRLRRERERAGMPAPALTMWLFPWASYAAIAGMCALLVTMECIPARARELNVSLVAAAVVIIAYLVVRALRNRDRLGESSAQRRQHAARCAQESR